MCLNEGNLYVNVTACIQCVHIDIYHLKYLCVLVFVLMQIFVCLCVFICVCVCAFPSPCLRVFLCALEAAKECLC